MNLTEVLYAGFCVCVFNIMPLNGLCSVCYHACSNIQRCLRVSLAFETAAFAFDSQLLVNGLLVGPFLFRVDV